MMGWFGGKAEGEAAPAKVRGQRYTVAGRPVRCPHCAGEQFTEQEVPLPSRTAALLETEWLAPGVYAMTCTECSAVQWFAATPERLES